MSKPQKSKRNAKIAAAAKPGSRRSRVAAVMLAVVVVAMGAFLWNKASHKHAQPSATAESVNQSNNPTPQGIANVSFAKLTGKWLRPDGGYILEIRAVAPDGKMDAAYFNPKPIHVAKAAALPDSGSVKVFIELRDVNYPGSTYTLAYDPSDDQLKGDYFQAALKQNFDVYFTRVQP